MISHLEANELFDLYSDLLTPRQKEVVSLYFLEDWSLSEICEHLGVSRAAVYDSLHKGVDTMTRLEGSLHLAAKNRALRTLIDRHPAWTEELEPVLEL